MAAMNSRGVYFICSAMFKKCSFNIHAVPTSARTNFIHCRLLHHHKRLNNSRKIPADFILIPDVFNSQEQYTLLTASLAELDRMGSRRAHRRMKQYKSEQDVKDPPTSIMNVFLPDHLYEFEEVRASIASWLSNLSVRAIMME